MSIDAGNVVDYVKLVWASLYTPRAMYYRRRLGVGDHGLRMAVLVQHMIDGDISGVMFTADPEHGKYVLIEAVEGLGERLVSGGADPASYLIRAEGCLSVTIRVGFLVGGHPPRVGGRWRHSG